MKYGDKRTLKNGAFSGFWKQKIAQNYQVACFIYPDKNIKTLNTALIHKVLDKATFELRLTLFAKAVLVTTNTARINNV